MFRSRRGTENLPLPLLILLAAAFLFGCALNPDDNGGGGGGGTGENRDRTSPANLVTTYLDDAYSKMDSTAYEEALDTYYRFEFVPDNPEDPEQTSEWWSKDEEMTIAGRMFNAWYNDENQRVTRIALTLTERSTTEDNTNYPEKPPGETWWKVQAAADLLVVVEDPSVTDGIMNYVVDSEQDFTVRPDPDTDSLWVIYKQVDKEQLQ